MKADISYYWVVICKNNLHNQQNRFFGHKVPLGETDPYSPLPTLGGHFNVRCDECGHEYSYKPSEVLRFSLEYRDYLVPHPLFRDARLAHLRNRAAANIVRLTSPPCEE